MIRLGIVDADNSHGISVAHVCNILKRVPMRATHIWGETEESTANAAQKGRIPNIVRDWRELLGQVDGVMINHRDGRNHFKPAKFFIEHGIPVFIDKPITTTVSQARRLFSLARKKNAALATFGVLTLQQGFLDFREALNKLGGPVAVNTTGPVDIHSPYGGVFFYGFHQIDIIVELLGTDARSVSFHSAGENGIATIYFADGAVASMNCVKTGAFHWMATTAQEAISSPHRYDEIPYLTYTRKLHRLFSRGDISLSVPRMLAPIAILESLQIAIESGKEQSVARLRWT